MPRRNGSARASGECPKPPPGKWPTWLILGGRGSSKTRAGAEWMHALASAGHTSELRIALLRFRHMPHCPLPAPKFDVSRRRLVWSKGTVALVGGSGKPKRAAVPSGLGDEPAKRKHGRETSDMLQTSCGLAAAARHHNARGDTLAEDADPGRRLTRISARANAANLAPAFIDTLDARCGGSRLGRQELEGELTEDR